MLNKNFAVLLPLLVSSLLLSACNRGSDSDDAAAGDTATATGNVTLELTDTPSDTARKVVVVFDAVRFIGSGDESDDLTIADDGDTDASDDVANAPTCTASGNSFDCAYDPPRAIDLLDFQGGLSSNLLENQAVPSGTYTQIRLLVRTPVDCNAPDTSTESHVENALGGVFGIFIPSGSSSGLKVNLQGPIEIDSDDDVFDFTIDFDLRKSLKKQQNKGKFANCYKMKPVLRIVTTDETGVIEGTVDPNLLVAGGCSNQVPGQTTAAVYVFEGNVTADDIDEDNNSVNPVTTAPVSPDGSGTYKAAFLTPGSYTLALSCNADQDDPETNETPAEDQADLFSFSDTDVANPIEVVAGETKTVDIAVP